jgi:hypothetical protein
MPLWTNDRAVDSAPYPDRAAVRIAVAKNLEKAEGGARSGAGGPHSAVNGARNQMDPHIRAWR